MILSGQKVTADDINAGPALYTPALTAVTTNPTLGTGATQEGFWIRNLTQFVMFEARIQFGTSAAAGTGIYEISLPTAVDTAWHNVSTTVGAFSVIGNGVIRDNSVSVGAGSFKILLGLSSANGGAGGVGLARMFHMDGTNSTVQSSTPFIWADSDRITVRGQYLMPQA